MGIKMQNQYFPTSQHRLAATLTALSNVLYASIFPFSSKAKWRKSRNNLRCSILSFEFKVFGTLREVCLHLLFPFLYRKTYPHPLQYMVVLHGAMAFDLCCQQSLPDTLSCLKSFYFKRIKYLLINTPFSFISIFFFSCCRAQISPGFPYDIYPFIAASELYSSVFFEMPQSA